MAGPLMVCVLFGVMLLFVCLTVFLTLLERKSSLRINLWFRSLRLHWHIPDYQLDEQAKPVC